MTDEITTLRSRIVTLESDNAELTKEREEIADYANRVADSKHEQLAAAQATIERLREALEAVETTCSYNGQEDEIGEHSCCHEPSYRPHSPDCWTHLRTKALALPNDTTALDARLKEERERCAKVCDDFGADAIRSMT